MTQDKLRCLEKCMTVIGSVPVMRELIKYACIQFPSPHVKMATLLLRKVIQTS